MSATDKPEDSARTLGLMVEGEARRVLSEGQLRADPALVAEGWERRFITDAARLAEVVALYEELGFEVRAVPVQAEQVGEDCEDCQVASLLRFQTVYTRRR
ncbi:MAG: hypothetical protein A2W29_07165 [Gemmatimonadetes bacterium RBG_16_66_8]|nr:MAG: hypothetical protein A2W29_07165 [Gemmatimonadetes bacterium RBG_16_66_8]